MAPRKRTGKTKAEWPAHDPLGLGDPYERLTMDEVNMLCAALLAGSGKQDAHEIADDDYRALIEWAFQALLTAELVRLMLDGLVVVRKSPELAARLGVQKARPASGSAGELTNTPERRWCTWRR